MQGTDRRASHGRGERQHYFNQGFTLPTLPTTGAFVALQGTMRKDGSVLASDVEVITTDSAFVAGRVLAFTPGTGAATSVTLWVDQTGGGTTALLDSVQTINIAAVTVYNLCPFNNGWFTTTNLFSSSLLLVGQRIFVGGTFVSPVFAPDLISLRRRGCTARWCRPAWWLPARLGRGHAPAFEHRPSRVHAGSALQVNTGAGTLFFQGNSSALTLTGLGTASATASVGVVARGLVLKDTVSGDAVLWAHRVRKWRRCLSRKRRLAPAGGGAPQAFFQAL